MAIVGEMGPQTNTELALLSRSHQQAVCGLAMSFLREEDQIRLEDILTRIQGVTSWVSVICEISNSVMDNARTLRSSAI